MEKRQPDPGRESQESAGTEQWDRGSERVATVSGAEEALRRTSREKGWAIRGQLCCFLDILWCCEMVEVLSRLRVS